MGIFDVSIPKWLEPVDQTTMAVAGYKGAMDAFQNSYNKAIEQKQFQQKMQLQTAEMAQNLELHNQQLELNRQHIENEKERIRIEGELKGEMEKERSAKLKDAPLMNKFMRDISGAKTFEELQSIPVPEFNSTASWPIAEQARQHLLGRMRDLDSAKTDTFVFKQYEKSAGELVSQGFPEGAAILSRLAASKGNITPEVSDEITQLFESAAKKREMKAIEKAELMPPSAISQMEKQLVGRDVLRQLEIMRDFGANEDPRYKQRYEALKLKAAKPSTKWMGLRNVPGHDEFGNPIEAIPPADKPPKVEGLNLGLPIGPNGNYQVGPGP